MNSPQLPPQRSVSIDQTEFDAALGREPAAHKNLAIRLDSHTIHRGARARPESGVQRAIGIEPAQFNDVLPVETYEVAANENLAVGLDGQCADLIVRARVERI